MSSAVVDCDIARELDDSGCVQDDSMVKSGLDCEMNGQAGLMDLSDEQLLYILKLCSTRDLKALGFSCPRLGRLVRERSLWRNVDARSQPCSRARFKWLLEHTLHHDTKLLKLSGYAKTAAGCLGLVNVTRKEAEEEKSQTQSSETPPLDLSNNRELIVYDEISGPRPVSQVRVHHQHLRCFIPKRSYTSPRARGYFWPEEVVDGRWSPEHSCIGPQFSLSKHLLQQLCISCPNLTELAFEYCNIDGNATTLDHFPKTLKRLSLRGSKCFNVGMDKSFLFRIQDYLPELQFVDVSECEWMYPATLLPLSKLPALTELMLRDCPKLNDFVAYVSLTARYGFRALKVLDLRGSPVRDCEVAALGWLPELEKLWLSAANKPQPPRHLHYADDEPVQHRQVDDWEIEEPFYFATKWASEMQEVEKSEEKFENFGNNLLRTTDNGCGDHDNANTTNNADTTNKRVENGSGDSKQVNSDYSPPRKRMKLNICFNVVQKENSSQDGEPSNEQEKGKEESSSNDHKDSNKNKDNSNANFETGDSKTVGDSSNINSDCNYTPPRKRVKNMSDTQEGKNNPSEEDSNKNADNSNVDVRDENIEDLNKFESEDESVINSNCTKDKDTLRKEKNDAKTNQKDQTFSNRDVKCGENSKDCISGNRNVKESDENISDENQNIPSNLEERVNRRPEYIVVAGPPTAEMLKRFSQGDFSPFSNLKSKESEPSCEFGLKPGTSSESGPSVSRPLNGSKPISHCDSSKPGPSSGFIHQSDVASVSSTLSVSDPSSDCIPSVEPGPSNMSNAQSDSGPSKAPKPQTSSASVSKSSVEPGPSSVSDARSNPGPIHASKLQTSKGYVHFRQNSQPDYLNIHIENRAEENQDNSSDDDQENKKEKYVHFRKNQDPIYVNCSPEQQARPEQPPLQYRMEPLHHVLYVSEGQHLNTYRLPRDIVSDLGFDHIDLTSLVTDFSIRRFGHADSEDINIINIGPQGVMNNEVSRPNRSNLRFLSVTGFRNITDRSLMHLATSAPHLTHIDFSETSITDRGAENFRSLRPDCELIYSSFKTENIQYDQSL